MPTLPITRIVLFKHGVGYFERRGPVAGEQLELSFPREAMDDVLKSLVALDLGAGQVVGVDFETPEDRAARLARGSIHLGDQQSLLDLLRDLRGRPVRLSLGEGKKAEPVDGLVVGVDYEPDEPLRRAIVSLYSPEARQVRAFPVGDLARVELLDEGAAADLTYFLRAAQSDEQRRAATLRLTPGDHDLLVGYIAPAPAWRVSYRLLYEEDQGPKTKDESSSGVEEQQTETRQHGAAFVGGPSSFVLLQGWGLFDNQLEEDLSEVGLTLMAGMPVSFRYRLYEPRTPERPFVQDEERTVDAPIFFEAAPPPAAMAAPATLGGAMMADMAAMEAPAPQAKRALRERVTAAYMEESVQVAAGGDERGALFAYSVAHPVSVARGQSAMVPIISSRLPARRELLYNGAVRTQRAASQHAASQHAASQHAASQHAASQHPVASLRLSNGTGLTLERGPVTVLDGGDYAGEAVLPFTRDGAELIVPFAVELGVKVDEERAGQRRLVAIRFQNEYAVFEEHDLVTTTYHITSSVSRPVEVTVEHGRLQGYDVAEPRAPDEESAGFARWRVPCPPQTRTTFAITERKLVTRSEQVRGLSGARLQEYLRDRLLDQATVKALAAILALSQQVAEAQAKTQRLGQEREALYKQQRQIQGNLQPLGRDGDEGALRQRYVTTLGQLEDRLAAIATDEAALRATIAALEEQVSKRLKRLAAQSPGQK